MKQTTCKWIILLCFISLVVAAAFVLYKPEPEVIIQKETVYVPIRIEQNDQIETVALLSAVGSDYSGVKLLQDDIVSEPKQKRSCPDIADTVKQHDLIVEWPVLDEAEIIVLAKMVWGEARGLSDTEKAATVWCVLNRVESWGKDIIATVTAAGQFTGYNENNPVDIDIAALVEDVLVRWEMEKLTGFDYGRVLPSEYLFFAAKNGKNVFRTEYRGGTRWDWSTESPYE